MENIDIAELVQNYVIPWGIKLLLALAIFYIGRMVVAAVGDYCCCYYYLR